MRLTTVDEVIEAIATLAIRGAPAIGIAGALGVALSARRHISSGRMDVAAVETDARRLAAARPTAVNSRGRWTDSGARPGGQHGGAVSGAGHPRGGRAGQPCRRRTRRRPRASMCGRQRLQVLTHCNTGRLATTAWARHLGDPPPARTGSGGVGVRIETRPLLQGASDHVELSEARIPHRLCVDGRRRPSSPAAWSIAFVGADRVAANGDVVNKIGTYALALAADRAGIPFIVVAPESTRDPLLASGDGCTIEQRSPEEVTDYAGRRLPPDTPVLNPAFDITPAGLITAVVTEDAVLRGGRASTGIGDEVNIES